MLNLTWMFLGFMVLSWTISIERVSIATGLGDSPQTVRPSIGRGTNSTRLSSPMEPTLPDDALDELSDDSEVKKLFLSFRNGTYRRNDFPNLRWADVPDLIRVGQSERILSDFPRNPFSSQYTPETREGVVALWLVEGIRRGGKFPSLNALCFSKNDDPNASFEARSAANHCALLKRYRDWWIDVRDRPFSEGTSSEPLADSELNWYGGN